MKKTEKKAEIYSVELTPLQRLLILPAFRQFAGPFENAEQGRVFRRLHEDLALPVIGRVADLHGGQLSAAQASSRAWRTFTLDFHELQMLKKVLAGAPRGGHMELEVGPLADRVDDIIGGKYEPQASTGAPPFDAFEESWEPPAPKEASTR